MCVDLEVANYDELRVTIYEDTSAATSSTPSNQKLVAQKFISNEGTDPDVTWDLLWMLEIGSFMYEIKYLRSMMPDHIDLLGWKLYHDLVIPPRKLVVEILQTVLMNWLLLCAQDDGCIAVPHAKMAEDPDVRKLLLRIKELEKKLLRNRFRQPAVCPCIFEFSRQCRNIQGSIINKLERYFQYTVRRCMGPMQDDNSCLLQSTMMSTPSSSMLSTGC